MKVKDLTRKTWAAVSSMPTTQEKSTTNPQYLPEEIGVDRIVVVPTHFNKKAFDEFTPNTEADKIR